MTEQDYLDLQENIKIGEEIAIYYEGDEYWMSRSQDGRFLLTRTHDSTTQFFDTAKDLFENGRIADRLLGDIYRKLD